MKPINVLRDHRRKLSLLLHLRKFSMRRVRLCIQKHHLILIKFIESLRILHKEAMTYNLLRRILILLLIKSVRQS